VFRLSATSGEGVEAWHRWLDIQRELTLTPTTPAMVALG
jgi:hypothetical protein